MPCANAIAFTATATACWWSSAYCTQPPRQTCHPTIFKHLSGIGDRNPGQASKLLTGDCDVRSAAGQGHLCREMWAYEKGQTTIAGFDPDVVRPLLVFHLFRGVDCPAFRRRAHACPRSLGGAASRHHLCTRDVVALATDVASQFTHREFSGGRPGFRSHSASNCRRDRTSNPIVLFEQALPAASEPLPFPAMAIFNADLTAACSTAHRRTTHD